MTTLTEHRDEISRNVARLRAAGCKVWTIIGHDPRSGRFVWGVRLPASVSRRDLLANLPSFLGANETTEDLAAEIFRSANEANTLVVRAVPGRTWSTDSRKETTANVAFALGWLADAVASAQTPKPAAVALLLTKQQVAGLRDLVNEYDNGGVSLELAEMLAESVREILPD